MGVQNVPLTVIDTQRNRNVQLSLENNSNMCFFNSVFQALFSFPSLWDHVKHFTTDRFSEADTVSNVKTLFRDTEQSRE